MQNRRALAQRLLNRFRQDRPFRAAWRAILRQTRERGLDLGQAETQFLDDQDEREPPDVGTAEPPLITGRPFRLDQAACLVEPDGGNRQPGPAREIANR